MEHKSSSELLSEAVERVRRHWQAQVKAEAREGLPATSAPALFSIAISRAAQRLGARVRGRFLPGYDP
jgi:hypothetical protein